MLSRPVRDMIDPLVAAPIPPNAGLRERRHAHRYAFRLPARLRLGESEYDVQCIDMGYGGMQLLAPNGVRPERGEHAVVTMRRGPYSYTDELDVVSAQPGLDGTMIHLAL